jgi:phage recombination protein Bet
MTATLVPAAQSDLVIASDQAFWTDNQLAVLGQLGVTTATPADLAVFFHQCTRTGLDPFAKQIYMLERQGKQTIQTGIDGFRLIGRRAADHTGDTIELTDTEWCGQDGIWRDVWLSNEPPAAARVAVIRNGGRFPAIAMYSEYVARKRNGDVNQMWTTRPAGQLAKCAEALAWRKAFPQDLSGLYTSDEMGQADSLQHVDATVGAPTGRSLTPASQPEPTPASKPPVTDTQLEAILAQITQAQSRDDLDAILRVVATVDLGQHGPDLRALWNARAEELAQAAVEPGEPASEPGPDQDQLPIDAADGLR